MTSFSFPKSFLCAAALVIAILGDTTTQAQPAAGGWTNRYHGPGNSFSYNQAYALAVDGNGNVIVTGYSVGANGFADYATIKYSGTGVPLWTNRYSRPQSAYSQPRAVAVDGDGGVLVTGYTSNPFSIEDYTTIKYSSAGVPLWTNMYNGPDNNEDQATAIAMDGSGNVIVTGYAYAGGFSDYATIKYSSAGVPLWTNRYNGPDNTYDQPAAVAVDTNGNVVVTGYSNGGGVAHCATIKYSGAGVPLWTNRYIGPVGAYDYASAVAVDRSGNVLVTGYSDGPDGNFDYLTIKYSSAGLPLWTNRYNGGNHARRADNVAEAMALDASGNVFVTGYSAGTNYYSDYATIAYSSAGVPLWTNRYHGPSNTNDVARALAVDGSGNVIVTGYSAGSGTGNDFLTIKYSNAGLPLWTNRYDGPANSDDQATALAVDGTGNVFVTGFSWNGTGYDFTTIKYSSAGAPLLSIARPTMNGIVLSWPSAATNFALQQNPNLTTTNWTTVGATPADDGTNRTIIINLPAQNTFYRLKIP